jgi:hypothetical protein
MPRKLTGWDVVSKDNNSWGMNIEKRGGYTRITPDGIG